MLLMVKRWLESPESGDWVLVLDNSDDKFHFFPEPGPGYSNDRLNEDHQILALASFIPQGRKGIVAITTRDGEVANLLADAHTISKEKMHPPEAELLFRNNYPKGEMKIVPGDSELLSLLDELQYLPLAIKQAASFLQMSNLKTLSQYLHEFRSTKKLLSKPSNNPWRYSNSHETVFTTFHISFQQIQKQSSLAGALIQVLACIDRQEIPHQMLIDLIESYEDDSDGVELLLDDALEKLISFSLIQYMSNGSYDIHALVHLSMWHFLEAIPNQKDLTMTKVSNFLAELPTPTLKTRDLWKAYFRHIFTFLEKKPADSLDVATICYDTSIYLEDNSRYEEAEKLAERSLTLRKSLLGEDSFDTWQSMSNLADIYRNQNKFSEAEKLEKRVMMATRKIHGESHPDTLRSMNKLAVILHAQEKYKGAHNMRLKIFELRKKTLGEQHPATLRSMQDLAVAICNQYNCLDAEVMQKRALELCKKYLGNEHLDTVECKSKLAYIHKQASEWDEAETLYEEVLKIRRRILGENHPNTLMSIKNLANIYRDQKRYEDAGALLLEELEARKRIYGAEHPDTLSSMRNLASMYHEQARYTEVETLRKEILEVCKRLLGENHIETLSSMRQLASTYTNQKRYKEAEVLQVEALKLCRSTFGEDHLETLQIMYNLAVTYITTQSCPVDAVGLLKTVVDIRTNRFGKKHTETEVAIFWLAQARGKVKDAQSVGIPVKMASETQSTRILEMQEVKMVRTTVRTSTINPITTVKQPTLVPEKTTEMRNTEMRETAIEAIRLLQQINQCTSTKNPELESSQLTKILETALQTIQSTLQVNRYNPTQTT
ncbi:Similar to Putative phosphatidate cytidylyltransferase; acc. no. Q9P381 [Pyronema omphalodes CBS 100304]|uniref:Similar to Putative phosphatidate cytidylyltransferase acc. no. Q9P381 n=1 Tax=Pyronema omphalodes (strain CBS 100304) TaxID=1076935 RepID=U4L8F0_PYROM|nr:Similar to Putative phosphatidate cytidylyltransferase; acc. no. Q9P381 [Pyronema omphalodes CBS 100304]